jgi:carbamoyl-phosphate synthase small subunit
MHGLTVRLGPSACLEIDGIRIAVVSGKKQLLDRALLRMVGIHAEQMRIIVVKSSNHFRADFQPIASRVLVAKAAGPMAADPSALTYAIDNVRQLVDRGNVPTFGICLGHQILGHAVGGKTFKLKFGHRGANHPVKELSSGKVEITSQNHGFAVDPDTLPSNITVTHLNLYDGTVEGFRHRDKPIFSVQYHPEASPGPHDADYLFRQFLDEMEKRA